MVKLVVIDVVLPAVAVPVEPLILNSPQVPAPKVPPKVTVGTWFHASCLG